MGTLIADGFTPWPAEFAERYRTAGYWQGMSLGAALWERADRHPDRVALVEGDIRLTYGQLVARADAAASRLATLGFVAGDRIVIQLPNVWSFVVLTLACFRSGVMPVMALPGHRRHELSYLVSHAGARAIAVPDRLRDFDHQALALELADGFDHLDYVLVAGEQLDERSEDLVTLCAADDAGQDAHRSRWDTADLDGSEVALFLLSGGTTGLPKLIPRTHDDYLYNARRSAEVSGLSEQTVYLVALPAEHNFPLACPGLLGTLLNGGRVVLVESPEPARALAAIAAEGVTHTAVVPAVAQRWLDHVDEHTTDIDTSSLEVLQVGGSRLVEEVARRVRPVLGCTLQQVFGMAEGLLNYTRLDDPDSIIVGTQGRPISPDDEIALVDENDQPVQPGEPGSLLTRGPYTLRGYYRAPEHNARAFTSDGWYRTGDICRRDDDGNLTVEGRDKDMINRGGEKISAEEIENLIYATADVSQVAAVAMPDATLGEKVCVYVVPRAGSTITLDALRHAILSRGVAIYKLPEELVVTEQLPMTKIGKIDKRRLREDIAGRLTSEGGHDGAPKAV